MILRQNGLGRGGVQLFGLLGLLPPLLDRGLLHPLLGCGLGRRRRMYILRLGRPGTLPCGLLILFWGCVPLLGWRGYLFPDHRRVFPGHLVRLGLGLGRFGSWLFFPDDRGLFLGGVVGCGLAFLDGFSVLDRLSFLLDACLDLACPTAQTTRRLAGGVSDGALHGGVGLLHGVALSLGELRLDQGLPALSGELPPSGLDGSVLALALGRGVPGFDLLLPRTFADIDKTISFF